MLFELSGLAELLDVGGHALADAGNFQQLLRLAEQGSNLVGRGLDRLGRAAIGADTEPVVAVDLHEIGGFVEDVRDGFVIQGESALPVGIAAVSNSGDVNTFRVVINFVDDAILTDADSPLIISTNQFLTTCGTWIGTESFDAWEDARDNTDRQSIQFLWAVTARETR